ncbi:hypothetical protein ACTFIR_012093 [Dictyostelium discoideum]
MGIDYIQLNEENSSFHNQNLNNNNNNNDNIYFNNVNTTYTPQLEKKLDSHYDQTFSPQIKPIITSQYSLDTQTPNIVLQSPQYYPPPNVNKTICVDDDESHFNSSLIFFILGFFISCLWLINIRYLKSKNKNAKTLATVSIALFIISMVLFLILIISSAGASSTYSY